VSFLDLVSKFPRWFLAEFSSSALKSSTSAGSAFSFAESTALAESASFATKLTAFASGTRATAVDGKVELVALHPDLF